MAKTLRSAIEEGFLTTRSGEDVYASIEKHVRQYLDAEFISWARARFAVPLSLAAILFITTGCASMGPIGAVMGGIGRGMSQPSYSNYNQDSSQHLRPRRPLNQPLAPPIRPLVHPQAMCTTQLVGGGIALTNCQ